MNIVLEILELFLVSLLSVLKHNIILLTQYTCQIKESSRFWRRCQGQFRFRFLFVNIFICLGFFICFIIVLNFLFYNFLLFLLLVTHCVNP